MRWLKNVTAQWNITEWNSPFVVVGDTGIGKSHLIHAIGKKQEEITRAIARLQAKMAKNNQLRKHVQQLSTDLSLFTDTNNAQHF